MAKIMEARLVIYLIDRKDKEVSLSQILTKMEALAFLEVAIIDLETHKEVL